jgi:hypothetical protein
MTNFLKSPFARITLLEVRNKLSIQVFLPRAGTPEAYSDHPMELIHVTIRVLPVAVAKSSGFVGGGIKSRGFLKWKISIAQLDFGHPVSVRAMKGSNGSHWERQGNKPVKSGPQKDFWTDRWTFPENQRVL